MILAMDVNQLVEAAIELDIRPRRRRWTHLSLCILDAVHSMDAHYDRVTVPLCWRYAELADLADPLLDVDQAHLIIGTDREQPLAAFADWAADLGEVRLAGVLGSHHRTWRRQDAPYKTRADIEYSQILVAHGVDNLMAAAAMLTDDRRQRAVEADLARVPGHGSGARRDYLWMLVGDDQHIKPDRMVLRWVDHLLGRQVGVVEARELIKSAAAAVGRTPWELDHAVWRSQSGRGARVGRSA
jgi:hypothetical protein